MWWVFCILFLYVLHKLFPEDLYSNDVFIPFDEGPGDQINGIDTSHNNPEGF